MLRTHKSDDGCTLIEIMVVVLILAVLMGLAIPTYIGFRGRTQDTETKSEVVNGAKVLGAFAAVDASGYTDDPLALKLFEPSLDFSGVADNSLHLVVADAVAGGDNGQVLVYSRSQSGTWFGLRLVNAGLTAGQYTCLGGSEADVDDMTDCTTAEW